jgi:hypothetical protein
MECRTWLGTTASEGKELPPGGHDEDGHGTHGASVVLQATSNTGIHVHVAQVFEKRHEKDVREVNEDDIIVTRIVNVRIERSYFVPLLIICRPSIMQSKSGMSMLSRCLSDSLIWYHPSMMSWNKQNGEVSYCLPRRPMMARVVRSAGLLVKTESLVSMLPLAWETNSQAILHLCQTRTTLPYLVLP